MLLTGLGGWAAAGTSLWAVNGCLPGSGSWRSGRERRNGVTESQRTDHNSQAQLLVPSGGRRDSAKGIMKSLERNKN